MPSRAPITIVLKPPTALPRKSTTPPSRCSRREPIARQEDIEAQEAEVRGLEGRVVEANVQLKDSTLRAPYDGVIAQRFVEQGQNVRAKEPVVQFQDVDEIDIVVDVPGDRHGRRHSLGRHRAS